MKLNWFAILAGLSIAEITSFSSLASTVPPTQLEPFISVANAIDTVYQYNPGPIYDNSNLSIGYSGESVQSNGLGQILVATAGVASGSGNETQVNATSQVDLEYYFELVGPSASSIAVDVSGTVSVSTTISGMGGIANASADSLINIASQAQAQVGFTANGTSQSQTANLSDIIYIEPNTVYPVHLNVETTAAAQEYTVCDSNGLNCYVVDTAANAIASLDPRFSIDSSVANSADYSFLFSSGIGNVTPVSVPASAPMFGAALMVVGAVGYGLKRKKVSATA